MLVCTGAAAGSIEFRGASFCWSSSAWARVHNFDSGETSIPQNSKAKQRSSTEAADSSGEREWANDVHVKVISDDDSASAFAQITLHAPRFKVSPGELIGCSGEVCSVLSVIVGDCKPLA